MFVVSQRLGVTPKAYSIKGKAKINWTFAKLKVCSIKDNVKEKRPRLGENICNSHVQI